MGCITGIQFLTVGRTFLFVTASMLVLGADTDYYTRGSLFGDKVTRV
jgi:hypothetical protein